MSERELDLLLADTILVIHFLFVAFVVLGFGAILVGRARGWAWVYNNWLRGMHMAAIVVVALQALLGRLCPLTTWENALRRRAGQSGYDETFVQHWLHGILFYDFNPWVFTLAYTAFAALVILVWIIDRDKAGSGK